jgi:TolA-binding protein
MKKLGPLLILALLLASCSQVNTMFNARRYFEAAQARPLNANGKPNNQAVEEYTKAIKKCGIILSNPRQDGRTDDALFLMAKALFYKGNSAFQAKDQFEALIKGFPESPYFGEAHIYLARVFREINRKEDGAKLLGEFILDPQHKKLHPRGLLTLAEFAIADKDYIKAQYWLQKIIAEYPRSKEYREAFFSFGQNYFIQKDYTSSLDEFGKIAGDPRIPSQLKLDARYYIALNQYELKDYDDSWKTLQRLFKDEDRPDKLSQARVLKSRLLFARGEAEDGVAEIEDITKSYPRTKSSAEAQYYLGEYYFYVAKDLEKAATAYNKVRSEFSTSELASPSQQKAIAVNQIKQKIGFSPESNLQAFVDYHISAAENYLKQFSLPDSALGMYQRIIDSRDSVQVLRDSVEVIIEVKQVEVDSLTVEIGMLPEPAVPDSITAEEPAEIRLNAPADTLNAEPATQDTMSITGEIRETEAGEADTLALADAEVVQGEPTPPIETELEIIASEPSPDSLDVPGYTMEEPATELPDSLQVEVEEEPKPVDPAELRKQLQRSLTEASTALSNGQGRLATLDGLLQKYDREIIPLALFSQASIYKKTDADSTRIAAILGGMQERFPGNKYTKAVDDMLAGRPIRLIDPEEEAQELRLDEAFGMFEAQPDSMVAILNDLAGSQYSPVKLRANFRLGWFYTFEAPDTTAAKPYLEEVLDLEQTGEYAALTARFFDGTKFKLNTFEELVDSLAVADSLRLLELLKAQADSLGMAADSTAIADSLADAGAAEGQSSEENTGLQPEEEPVPTLDAPEKKEDAPVEPPSGENIPEDIVPEGDTLPPSLPDGPSE